MKSHVQDGVVGLRADSSEPAPLRVRVVRPLTLNHVPCPVSPSLTAWRTARGFAVVAAVLSPVLCAGGKPAPLPFNHVSYSCWECITSWLSPGCSPWEPSITVSGWQDLAGGRQWMLQALGLTLPYDSALLGLGLLGGSRYLDRAAPGSLPCQWRLRLQTP